MFKKLIKLYQESIILAMRYPRFTVFFIFSNIIYFLNYLDLGESKLILYPFAFILRLALLGGIGYIVIYLLRKDELPHHIFQRGIVQNFWNMLKYMLLQLVIITLTSIIPMIFLESKIIIPLFIQYFWLWVNEFVFIFMTFEAIFWEDKGIGKAYRFRNIFMLARFEWLFAVFCIIKMPFFIVSVLKIRGVDILFSGPVFLIPVLFIAFLDWVNTIYSFKVYGTERLTAIAEVEEKIKESSKQMKQKIRKRRIEG